METENLKFTEMKGLLLMYPIQKQTPKYSALKMISVGKI